MDGPSADDTVRVRPPPNKQFAPARTALIASAGFLLALAAAAGAWSYFFRPTQIVIDTETEAQIDAAQPCALKISRFAADPSIVVIDFPSLTAQGLMLDRVAALIEKAGLPRDRVLGDVELREAIYNCGDTIESYYYGHDYKAADLKKFFQLADADHIALNGGELWLKNLLLQLGWMLPNANGALITLPAAGGPIDPHMRAVILHHEISHGAFYTIPIYARYATDFWNSLTAADRAAFTSFLGRQGYDTSNTSLMLNETQAYLIFTRDPLFFDAAAVGMTNAQINILRTGYIAGIPVPWLQPMAKATLATGPETPAMCSGAG
jgi:hypothetical protein